MSYNPPEGYTESVRNLYIERGEKCVWRFSSRAGVARAEGAPRAVAEVGGSSTEYGQTRDDCRDRERQTTDHLRRGGQLGDGIWRQLWERRGLSQKAAAQALNTDRHATIAEIESGKRRTTFAEVVRLATAYGV